MDLSNPYIAAAIGGAFIGLSSGLFYLLCGKIAGISNLISDGFLRAPELWRWGFVAGLAIAGLLVPTSLSLNTPLSLLVIGGLLVGFGTRLGNGCTSGHGVCGLARLSWRSLVAVLVFMATGAATAFVVNHLI